MKARWKRVFLARYIVWIEVAGYLGLLLLMGGVVYSTLYVVDDACKVNAAGVVGPRIESVSLGRPSYVLSVEARFGEAVEKGAAVLTVAAGGERTDRLVAARVRLLEAREALGERGEGDALGEAVARAVAETDALASGPGETIVAPLSGVLRPIADGVERMEDLTGSIREGGVAEVRNYGSLRFRVEVGGRNAHRVRIHQLARDDVRDWKGLTGRIRSESAPEGAGERRVWEMLRGKLKEVKPNRVPNKRRKGEVIAALSAVLGDAGLYDSEVWGAASLGEDARGLVERGVGSLSFDERVRLNRALLEETFGEILAESEGSRQPVKARVVVKPVEGEGESALVVYEMRGEVVSEVEGGTVEIELSDPDPALVAYLKACAEDSSMAAPDLRASIVVDRISAFRFLFRKE